MFKNKSDKNENILRDIFIQAFKMELNTEAGKYNLAFTTCTLIISFLIVSGGGICDVINTCFSASKLGVIYEPKSNLMPLYISMSMGFACFLLMVFISIQQSKVKGKIDEIKNGEDEKVC